MCEIEVAFAIFSTSIHSILHEHLAVKKICPYWIPNNSTIAQKYVRVDWCKEMLEKYYGGAAKNVNKIVTDDESWVYVYEPETKQQSIVCVFDLSQICQKLFVGKNHFEPDGRLFLRKTTHVATVPLEQRRTVDSEWYTTICCLKSWQKFEKRTREDESLYTMAMRALGHQLKSATFWQANTSN